MTRLYPISCSTSQFFSVAPVAPLRARGRRRARDRAWMLPEISGNWRRPAGAACWLDCEPAQITAVDQIRHVCSRCSLSVSRYAWRFFFMDSSACLFVCLLTRDLNFRNACSLGGALELCRACVRVQDADRQYQPEAGGCAVCGYALTATAAKMCLVPLFEFSATVSLSIL